MTIEKFRHLDDKKPNPKEILKIPVDMVSDEHLSTLRDYFKVDVQQRYSFDTEVVNAAWVIISKIDRIINLWHNKISWESMKAANDENYSRSMAA